VIFDRAREIDRAVSGLANGGLQAFLFRLRKVCLSKEWEGGQGHN
jgi:hypothetical protein